MKRYYVETDWCEVKEHRTCDSDVEFVRHTDALAALESARAQDRERIEELEWLVEVQDYHNSGWACLLRPDAAMSVIDIFQAARAAAGV